MLLVLQKTSVTDHNYTTAQHMILIPSVQTTKFGLRNINFHDLKKKVFIPIANHFN